MAVAVDLDPVSLGIVEVERLGDEMVRGAREPPPGRHDPVDGARELGAGGHEERKMEQSRRPRWPRRRVGSVDERDERGVVARGPELDGSPRAAISRRPIASR